MLATADFELPYVEINNIITNEMCNDLLNIQQNKIYDISFADNITRILNTSIHKHVLLLKDINYVLSETVKIHINTSNTPSSFTSDTYITQCDGQNKHQIMTFHIFLNDDYDGGEINIMNTYIVSPLKCKGVFIYSGWCFPYKFEKINVYTPATCTGEQCDNSHIHYSTEVSPRKPDVNSNQQIILSGYVYSMFS
jgi:hypothetical protein